MPPIINESESLGGAVHQPKARIEATWTDSTFAIGGRLAGTDGLETGARPINLRVVLVDKTTLEPREHHLPPPSVGASKPEFAIYWNSVGKFLDDAHLERNLLVMATERWPRDARYVPPQQVREKLEQNGVRHVTFARWDDLTRDVMPCALAGISFVSMSSGGSLDSGFEALSTGFALKGGSPRPQALVSAYLVRRGDSIELILDESAEMANSNLSTFQCIKESQFFMCADPGDSGRMKGLVEDPSNLGQYWYLYPSIEESYMMINYQTCGVILGNVGQGESRLVAADFEKVHYEVLWYLRGTSEADRHLTFPPNKSLNQCLVGDRIAVRPWDQAGLHWRQHRYEL